MKIIVAPLRGPSCTTVSAWSSIVSADRLFVQTADNPFVRMLTDAGLAFKTMDELYDSSDDFDDLYDKIAEKLIQSGEDCVYVPTGETASILSALEAKREQNGFTLVSCPAMPLSKAAFPEMPDGYAFPANSLPADINPLLPVYITEIDTELRAGEVKLFLTEYYPDEWNVILSYPLCDGTYQRKTLPLYELDRFKHYHASYCLYIPAIDLLSLERFGYNEFSSIMRILRSPKGCTWDREQTNDSLKTDLIEECYEVIDAIEKQDDFALCEEIGDVLMNLVLQSVICEEQGRFSLRDVTTEISKKMIFRHPHVFKKAVSKTSEEILSDWEELKKQEKGIRSDYELMQSVPNCMPSLIRAFKVMKKALKADPSKCRDYIYVQNGAYRKEDIGKRILSVVSDSVNLHIDAEESLRHSIDELIETYKKE